MRAILGHGGKLKCYIRETANGKELLGPGGRFLGSYNENTDQTFRPGNQFYSYGDCLTELLNADDD